MTLTDEERAEPRHHPDNYTAWNSYFCGGGGGARLLRRPAASASAQQRRGPPTLVERAGRTLEAVLDHIEGGNFPVLTMPPSRASASRRRETSGSHGAWLPARLLAGRSSLAPVKREEATSPSTPVRVKKEPASPPPTEAPTTPSPRTPPGVVQREWEREEASSGAMDRPPHADSRRAPLQPPPTTPRATAPQAAPPKVPKVEDDGCDDGGDDYTVFYRRMGM
ncbi:hypothetical protein QYE76_067921 [Lolium multiflorum]|uniref:Uncharacterized protein n=1 Tax=Lolium multiflorum TaxID=4521 RepID=A0AAD8WB68_LOLMU|nr:hypothetical protein QYE76_067921 [Lolium multiflorum]